MQITELKLTNFRNYNATRFLFTPGKNIIIGNNGVGKTNIVEAIYYLSITKSFRATTDQVVIKDAEEYATIEGNIKKKMANNYKIVIDKTGKKVFINQYQVKKISDYISQINIVLFNPEDLKLIKDNPSTHRKLINMELSGINNTYLKLLSSYNKVLKQRNTYLKSMLVNGMMQREFLDVLTKKLVDLGLAIYEIRTNFIDDLRDYLEINYQKITKKSGIALKYVSDYDNLSKELILKKYHSNFKKDLNYGKTNFGVHLDDFIFYFNDKLAKDYLSEGEQKNAIIAFKLAEINIYYHHHQTMPILILDDLFSELDQDKITKIIKFFKKNMQIFITTTDLTKIDNKILNNSKVFTIKPNKIEEKIYE